MMVNTFTEIVIEMFNIYLLRKVVTGGKNKTVALEHICDSAVAQTYLLDTKTYTTSTCSEN